MNDGILSQEIDALLKGDSSSPSDNPQTLYSSCFEKDALGRSVI